MHAKKTLLCLTLSLVAIVAFAQEQKAAAPKDAKAAATTAGAAPAAAPAAVELKGDAARGRELAYTCKGCHGVRGYKNAYPSYHVPRIGGQSETYLRTALGEYRAGSRKHPTMQAQANSYSNQQIADIAAYLSSLK